MKKVVAAAGMAVVSEVSASAKSEFSLIDENLLKSRIYTIRGVKVMLDADLAEIYGYSTKAFNQQVKNNIERFADDFRFQLSNKEIEELSRCKFCTLNTGLENNGVSRSKFLTLNKGSRGSNIKYAPFAFTEQGIYMHCSQGSASSKDGGNRIMTIMQVECPDVYHTLVDSLCFTRPLDP